MFSMTHSLKTLLILFSFSFHACIKNLTDYLHKPLSRMLILNPISILQRNSERNSHSLMLQMLKIYIVYLAFWYSESYLKQERLTLCNREQFTLEFNESVRETFSIHGWFWNRNFFGFIVTHRDSEIWMHKLTFAHIQLHCNQVCVYPLHIGGLCMSRVW